MHVPLATSHVRLPADREKNGPSSSRRARPLVSTVPVPSLAGPAVASVDAEGSLDEHPTNAASAATAIVILTDNRSLIHPAGVP